jgi:hypothetical protein
VSSLKAMPMRYRGTQFRSTLEADWAATFDELRWYWEYEPLAIELKDGSIYRPDFFLPSQRVWCEVKGPHNERIKKTIQLHEALEYDEWTWGNDLVVVLRPPGPGERAQWEGAGEGQDIVIVLCPECEHHGFMDMTGAWSCRRHLRRRKEPNKFWQADDGGLWYPGELAFKRAPRKQKEA